MTAAASGDEALRRVEKEGLQPDLAITDVVMPGMSGVALGKHLRRRQPDLRILYMSGYAEDAIVHHGMLDPELPFIQKPFSTQELIAKVMQVAQDGRSSNATYFERHGASRR